MTGISVTVTAAVGAVVGTATVVTVSGTTVVGCSVSTGATRGAGSAASAAAVITEVAAGDLPCVADCTEPGARRLSPCDEVDLRSGDPPSEPASSELGAAATAGTSAAVAAAVVAEVTEEEILGFAGCTESGTRRVRECDEREFRSDGPSSEVHVGADRCRRPDGAAPCRSESAFAETDFFLERVVVASAADAPSVGAEVRFAGEEVREGAAFLVVFWSDDVPAES